MENKNKGKETSIYNIEWLDNGVTVHSSEYDIAECEKFSNSGNSNDTAMIAYFGKLFWEDIRCAIDILLKDKLKITITIEEDE